MRRLLINAEPIGKLSTVENCINNGSTFFRVTQSQPAGKAGNFRVTPPRPAVSCGEDCWAFQLQPLALPLQASSLRSPHSVLHHESKLFHSYHLREFAFRHALIDLLTTLSLERLHVSSGCEGTVTILLLLILQGQG